MFENHVAEIAANASALSGHSTGMVVLAFTKTIWIDYLQQRRFP